MGRRRTHRAHVAPFSVITPHAVSGRVGNADLTCLAVFTVYQTVLGATVRPVALRPRALHRLRPASPHPRRFAPSAAVQRGQSTRLLLAAAQLRQTTRPEAPAVASSRDTACPRSTRGQISHSASRCTASLPAPAAFHVRHVAARLAPSRHGLARPRCGQVPCHVTGR